jgi:mRNA interferase HicA
MRSPVLTLIAASGFAVHSKLKIQNSKLPFGLSSLPVVQPSICASMKRNQLLKHLKKHGATLLREGRRHSIYQKGDRKSQVPRHNEIVDELARKICKDLDIGYTR